MDNRSVIELIAVIGIAAAPLLILIERFAGDRGIGARTIQFLAVAMLVPLILVLALEKLLEPATIGTLIGALTGYLLSGIGDYRPDKKRKPTEDETPPAR
jgi:hypothetical protein